MRIIDGDKTDDRKQYVLASEAKSIEKELTTLREELAAKNNFLACCDIIARIPGTGQHIVQDTAEYVLKGTDADGNPMEAQKAIIQLADHVEEKRISKMSGVWDTGVIRRRAYRVVLWHAKGGCADCQDPSLRTAVAQACEKLKLPFPPELE